MVILSLAVSLPASLLKKMSKSAGIAVDKAHNDISIYNISDSSIAMALYKDYLLNNTKFMDPLLSVTFGDPCNPYISTHTQREVYNLLFTFQPLLEADFFPGAKIPEFRQAVYPVHGGVRYDQCNIAIQAVQEELRTLNLFAAQCPGLALLVPGQIICHLDIIHKDTIIVVRICKC